MKILCIDPITSKGSSCSLSLYSESYEFLYQHIVSSSHPSVDKCAKSKLEYICFDAFKTFNAFDFRFPFVHDVKVLYSLKGTKFNNLIDLGKIVLGFERMEKYIEFSQRMSAHLHSYKVAKVNLKGYEETDLLPVDLVTDMYRERSAIILDLYREFDDKNVKSFYQYMFKNMKALHLIAKNPLNIDLKNIEDDKTRYATMVTKNTVNNKAKLKFNAVGAKTGRLGFEKGFINVYTLPKRTRRCIVAREDYSVVQFDFKSLHPRLAIFSTKDDQFKNKFANIEDIYSVFPGDREENKIAFLAWMYSSSRNSLFDSEAHPIRELKEKLYLEARRTGKIINEFGRVLYFDDDEDKVVFQNYITSLEVDVILTLIRWLVRGLEHRKSRVLFPFHDAIVCEIHKDEMDLISKIKDYMEVCHKKMFESILPVEVSIGKNYEEMNEW